MGCPLMVAVAVVVLFLESGMWEKRDASRMRTSDEVR